SDISTAVASNVLEQELARQEQEKADEDGHHGFGLLARLRNYFFAGVLVTAPISITVWITWNIVAFVDSRVTPLMPPAWNPESYLPF
ncbi:hypothetical protein SB781_36295, partial [Paraburkholderia sp. SIMBA_061]